MAVRCGNRKAHGVSTESHHHEDAITVRACFATPDGLMSIEQEAEEDAAFQDAAKAERAYEYFLETQYSDVMAWEEEQENRRLMWL